MVLSMEEELSVKKEKTRLDKAEQIADFILNPEKLARITQKTLHKISTNFLDRQEKENLKKIRNLETLNPAKIGRIERLATLGEYTKRSKKDIIRFEANLINMLNVPLGEEWYNEYIKLTKIVKRIEPIINKLRWSDYHHNNMIWFRDLENLVDQKKLFIRNALCSLAAKKIYDSKLANYRLETEPDEEFKKLDHHWVHYSIRYKTIKLIFWKKYREIINVYSSIDYIDTNNIIVVIDDDSKRTYILHDRKDDFDIQKTIDGEDIRSISTYPHSITASLWTKDKNIPYRCTKNDQWLYIKESLM